MQMGPDGEEAIVDLFADDATYVSPFDGQGSGPRTHIGKPAIREAFRTGLKWNPPDFRISLDRLEIEGDELVSHWTCSSAAMPAPVRGTDSYVIKNGKIARLETRLAPSEPAR